LNHIYESLKTKLNLHDIDEQEIDMGYRKERFQELYKITGLLGVGAFGVVLEALNKTSNEIVAVKVIT
jgi:hypothetical protein